MKMNERIRALRRELKLNQPEFGRAIGSSKQAVSNWEAGRNEPDGASTLRIVHRFGVNADWLQTGRGDMFARGGEVTPGPSLLGRIPLIAWAEASTYAKTRDLSMVSPDKEIEVSRPMSPGSFALRVQGDSMQAPDGLSIPDGYIVHVDPEQPWKNGSIVIAQLDGEHSATIKQIRIDGDRHYLAPLNPRYPIIDATGRYELIGVVVQASFEIA